MSIPQVVASLPKFVTLAIVTTLSLVLPSGSATRGCSMRTAETPLWWDRNIDRTGRPIRPDVRAAAHEIWSCAIRQALSLTSDSSQAPDLMENAVAQVSSYLDRGGVTLFSREINGLLMRAFQRGLHRHAVKLRRFKTLGTTGELSSQTVDRTSTRQLQAHIELEQIVGRLCARSRTVLALRYAGYTWKEAALALTISVPALRSAFWRDVERVKKELKIHSGGGSDHPVNQELLGRSQ
jgi:DNA-directed RNA polymerase specialized sigma24 family protein